MRERFGSSGRSQIRSAAWSKYLFSGLLVCGECGARITIVAGNGKRAYPKYGCPNHRYRGTCNNRLLIRLDRLETQLLAGLEQRVLSPSAVEYVVGRLQDEIKAYCTNAGRANDISRLTALEKEKIEIEDQAQRIVDAIAAAGHSAVLLQRLSDIENRLGEVDRKISASRPVMREPALSEIRDFVTRRLLNLRGLLRENVPRAKRELLEHVQQITLTPVQNMTAYAVSGSWELLPTGNDVISMVARDGVERFSGLCNQQVADCTMDTKDTEDSKVISCVRFVCGFSSARKQGQLYRTVLRRLSLHVKMMRRFERTSVMCVLPSTV